MKFLGDNSPGGNNSGVIVRGAEVRGVVVLGDLIGANCRESCCPVGHYSGVIFRGGSPGLILLGVISWGALVWEAVVQREMSGYH